MGATSGLVASEEPRMTTVQRGARAEPVAGALGAEIHGVDLAGELDDRTVTTILDELTRHKVIFFRDQHLDDDSQVAFARRLGPVTIAHPTVPGVATNTRVLDVNTRANAWHTDVTFLDRPPSASVLRAVELPPYGGDTVWANTALAYETLPAPLRTMADGLWAIHTNAIDYVGSRRPSKYAQVFTSTQYETRHPVVRVHPRSGERSLLLGNFARQIVGVGAAPSHDLLRNFQDHITRLEHTVRWRWRPGDVAIWDNQATQHYAIADYGKTPRSMHRVTLAGDLPVSITGERSEAIVGDSASYVDDGS
jgi:alpha-ketoglutarate-dependent taurine dioxygenase